VVKSFQFSDLRLKNNNNDTLTRSEVNSLINNARRQTSEIAQSAFFNNNEYGNILFDKSVAIPYFFPCKCAVPISANSLFTIRSDGSTNTAIPFLIEVAQYDQTKPALVMLTNGNTEINGTGVARCIDQIIPTPLAYDTPSPPKVNEECGFKDLDFKVTYAGIGLLCLALDTTNFIAYCVATRPGRRLLVKPDADIAINSAGDVRLWTGSRGSEAPVNPVKTFNAHNRTSAVCKAAKFCEMLDMDGKLYLVPWEC